MHRQRKSRAGAGEPPAVRGWGLGSELSSYRLARRLQAVADLERHHGDKPLAYLVELAVAAAPNDLREPPKDAAP